MTLKKPVIASPKGAAIFQPVIANPKGAAIFQPVIASPKGAAILECEEDCFALLAMTEARQSQ